MSLAPVQMDSGAVQQKPAKSKSEKTRKTADRQASTDTQPAENTHLHTHTLPHTDDGPRKAPVLDIEDAVLQELKEFAPNAPFHNHSWMLKVIRQGNILKVTMTEAELLSQEKKKKKKNKRHRLGAAPEPSSPHETTTGVDSVKTHTHKKKKKKKKSKRADEDTPAEVPCGVSDRKKKRKHEAVTPVMTEESTDVALPQEGEVRKKKRRTEETVSAGENTGADVSLAPVQMDSGAVQQKPAKSKSEKTRKTADRQASTDTQPAENTHLHTHTPPHTDDGPRKAPVLDIEDAVLQELKEFAPNAPFHNHHWIRKLIQYDLPRFREFKKQGIPLRTGKFTGSENKRLKENIKNFLLISGIDSTLKLFKPHRFPEEKTIIRGQKRRLGFLPSLCAGIPRNWHNILSRARKMSDEENYLGKFTEDENEALKKLYTLHGTNWVTISDKMGRSYEAVQKRFSMMTDTHGSWAEEELKSLLTSVRQLLLERAEPGADGDLVIKKKDLYKKLAWVKVAEQQSTRSWLQCREKWMDYLTKRMTSGGAIKGRKSLTGQIQLIRALNEMAVEEPSDIVWDDLTHLFGNTPPDYLQMRYYQLKVIYVPGWYTMSFCDIVDFLYEQVLPKLEKQLEMCEEEDVASEERQSYKLSEIFPDLP
ncbi:transcription termination factor 1-like isoform X3 [Alosa sapidissima]|uniref:transcription termination factor 1-like isoform X1 n=1 Tax=Alosa sapidissima TaxID=34773 RepID=UPI001C086B3A|nr:transcription termination factor 1-like isoform X1 [Alosa sapidissima]XP_041956505.1 transcription termination factor 1-like isoform X3 [Alosa sapidissima]